MRNDSFLLYSISLLYIPFQLADLDEKLMQHHFEDFKSELPDASTNKDSTATRSAATYLQKVCEQMITIAAVGSFLLTFPYNLYNTNKAIFVKGAI